MEQVYGWLHDLAVFFILMTAVLNLVPKEDRKYFRFFLGLVMLTVLCRPIFETGSSGETFREALRSLTHAQEMKELRGMQIWAEEFDREMLENVCKEELGKMVRQLLEEEGCEVLRAEVTVRETEEGVFAAERIQATVRLTGQQATDARRNGRQEELRKLLGEVCGLPKSHILLYIRE